MTETHSEPSQTSKTEGFSNIGNGFQSLTILAKRSISRKNYTEEPMFL